MAMGRDALVFFCFFLSFFFTTPAFNLLSPFLLGSFSNLLGSGSTPSFEWDPLLDGVDCNVDCTVDCSVDCSTDCRVDCSFDCRVDCRVDCSVDCSEAATALAGSREVFSAT